MTAYDKGQGTCSKCTNTTHKHTHKQTPHTHTPKHKRTHKHVYIHTCVCVCVCVCVWGVYMWMWRCCLCNLCIVHMVLVICFSTDQQFVGSSVNISQAAFIFSGCFPGTHFMRVRSRRPRHLWPFKSAIMLYWTLYQTESLGLSHARQQIPTETTRQNMVRLTRLRLWGQKSALAPGLRAIIIKLWS